MGLPKTTPITEARHAWGFMVGDINDGQFSRGQIVLAAGSGVLTAGMVLGLQLVGATAVAAALGANTGNPTFSAITVSAPAVAGAYVLRMQDATHYVVETPTGVEIGHGVAGAAFAAGGLGFTLTAGATPAVAGDSFTITPAAGSGQYAPYDPTKSDGTEVACAILGSSYRDTTLLTQKAGALLRGPSKVQAAELIWGPNVTTIPQQAAALAQLQLLGILSV
jgi:hypothetical protein